MRRTRKKKKPWPCWRKKYNANSTIVRRVRKMWFTTGWWLNCTGNVGIGNCSKGRKHFSEVGEVHITLRPWNWCGIAAWSSNWTPRAWGICRSGISISSLLSENEAPAAVISSNSAISALQHWSIAPDVDKMLKKAPFNYNGHKVYIFSLCLHAAATLLSCIFTRRVRRYRVR